MLWQKHNRVFYLCDLRNETLYEMVDVSYEIIEGLFNRKKSVGQVIKNLSEKYKLDEMIIKEDVFDFINSLIEAELISEVK